MYIIFIFVERLNFLKFFNKGTTTLSKIILGKHIGLVKRVRVGNLNGRQVGRGYSTADGWRRPFSWWRSAIRMRSVPHVHRPSISARKPRANFHYFSFSWKFVSDIGQATRFYRFKIKINETSKSIVLYFKIIYF